MMTEGGPTFKKKKKKKKKKTRLKKQHACYFLKINFWTVCFQHILKEMLGQFVSSFHCTFDALILQENIHSQLRYCTARGLVLDSPW